MWNPAFHFFCAIQGTCFVQKAYGDIVLNLKKIIVPGMFILIALSLIVSLLSGFWTKEEKTELATPVYQVPDPSPNPQFVSPMHIPLSLAANFCEVRKDHYHMGLDVRTEQRENLPVYSVEDAMFQE